MANLFIPRNKWGDPLPRSERWGNIMYEEDLRQKEAEKAKQIEKARAEAAGRAAAYEALLRNSNFGAMNAEIKEQLKRLKSLNDSAKEGLQIKDIVNPRVGDFKSSEDGKKLYRFTDKFWKEQKPAPTLNQEPAEKVPNPRVGNYKKVKDKIFKFVEEPTWRQVDRSTNYNIDLGETFDRQSRLGEPYLDARDKLWSIFYPGEPPIRRKKKEAPATKARRNTRRANRRNTRRNRRNGTRKY